MLHWLGRRLLTSFVTLFGITTITFLLARVIPSDPAVVYIGPLARPAEIARVTKQLGLDRPLPVQYVKYLQALVKGDWGTSLATKEPVLGGIVHRLPATLELVLLAMLIAVVVGIPLGVLTARRAGSAVRRRRSGRLGDRHLDARVLARAAAPGALSAASSAGCRQRAGSASRPRCSIRSRTTRASHCWTRSSAATGAASAMPASTSSCPRSPSSAYPLGLLTRMTRASMLDVLNQDYIRTARTFGLSERLIQWRLALRNALPATLTVAGLSFAYLLTGTFFVELVYDWPGIGQFGTNALLNLDYPVIMGITLFGAIGFLSINLAVDIVQARLDPRVRLE